MNLKQKTFWDKSPVKLDEKVNEFQETQDVKYTQSYCGNSENGVLIHFRILLYETENKKPNIIEKTQQKNPNEL